MPKRNRDLVVLFGKSYFWMESERGNLQLVPLASIAEMQKAINATFQKMGQISA